MSSYSPKRSHADQLSSQAGSSEDTFVGYPSLPEEDTPLLPGRTQRRMSLDKIKFIAYCLLGFTFLSFIFVNLIFHFTNCPLYPSTMNAIRQDWEKQVSQHELFLEEWRLEKHQHATTEEEWKLQGEWHERDVSRRIRDENERQERVRREWAQEYERHVHEIEEYEQAIARRIHEEQERQEWVRKGWDQELLEHKQEIARRTREEEERQEMARREWAQEMEQYRQEWEEMGRRENEHRESERQKWRREVEDHDRIEEERRKREKEERQKLNMFWGRVDTHTCTTYGAREYTAQLMNLPVTWEHRIEACKATPLEVHGVSYLPKSCEDKGPGHVVGRWEINQHEPDCVTFWSWYKDKGCTSPGSGRRRIEHYLANLPKGGDWREFCATTPARFRGLVFSGAQECFQYNGGTYGHWEIDDGDC